MQKLIDIHLGFSCMVTVMVYITSNITTFTKKCTFIKSKLLLYRLLFSCFYIIPADIITTE